MPQALRDRLLGGAARACRPDQIAAQAREVLFVLLEQDSQVSGTAGSAPEPAAGVHHGQAAFVAVHHSPGGALLVGIRRDLLAGRASMMPRRAAFESAARRRSIETRPDEPPRLENDDILGAPESSAPR